MIKWKNLIKEDPQNNGYYVIVNADPDKFEMSYPNVLKWTPAGWNTCTRSDGSFYDKHKIEFKEYPEGKSLYYCSIEDWNKYIRNLIHREEVE